MSKKDKQYTIYIRSTKESIPVNKEEFDAYYSVFAKQNTENKNPLKWEPILTVTDFFDSLKPLPSV